MNTNKKVLGIVLVCIGLLILAPIIPKVLIIIIGVYLIILGIKFLKFDDY